VSGLAATHPPGSVFWGYLHWTLRFARLGHDVLYVEDTGRWVYDPASTTFVEGGGQNAAMLAEALKTLEPGLAKRWFYRDGTVQTYGWAWADVVEFCPTADLFVHISGEWSVPKHAYVASRSGWFSCRSACYLALGVPVVVQDTGFGCAIPIGRVVLPFGTMEEAVDAVERLVADPAGHAVAAPAIACEYFDSDRVLNRLIDQAACRG